MRSLRANIAFLFVSIIAVASAAYAHDEKLGEITIDRPWARATAKMAKAGAVYMTLRNQGQTADRLIAISTDISKKASLHRSIVEDGIMKMRPMSAIDLPPGGQLELKPGGYHIMLMGLSRQLVEDDRFTMTLTFERIGAVTVQVMVGSVAAMDASPSGHDASSHGTKK